MDTGKAQDLVGMRFGDWTVLCRCPPPEGVKWGTFWMCSCSCGETFRPIRASSLKHEKIEDCVCTSRRKLIGERFGKWTVKDVSWRPREEPTKRPPIRFLRDKWAKCVCDCGVEKDVRLASLIIGDSTSCGCTRGYDNPLYAPITKIIGTYRRQAEEGGRSWELDRELATTLLTSNCYYCGIPPSNTLKTRNQYIFKYSGIDRIDNSQGYAPGNVVSSCKICNLAKHASDQQEFLATIKRVYEHLNLEKATFAELPSPPPSSFVAENRRRWDQNKRKAGQEKRRLEKFPKESC
jgi:hypothetical protein